MTDSIILTSSDLDEARIELFVETPVHTGPRPAILFVHGHQRQQPHPGGRSEVDSGRLDRALAQGYVAGAVSMPGYGASDGPPDFCGPCTQAAVRTALVHLRGLPQVDASRLVLWGRSRGAITSAMVATQEPELAVVVLTAGIYDFHTGYPTPIPGIDDYIRREAGVSHEAFQARSAYRHAERITMPTLIIHAADDERAPAVQAQMLYDRLHVLGAPVRLAMLPSGEHRFPILEEERVAYPFLTEILAAI